MPPSVHVIVNPASASGGGEAMVPALEEALTSKGIGFALERTREPGHGVELARRAVSAGARTILSVGGDGTIHEVANGILEGDRSHAVAVAVLPVGTGNDFYRMVKAPASLEGAVEMLVRGVPTSFDVGLARWEGGSRHFVNLAGMGIDVEVIRRREGFRRLKGLAQYLMALMSALARYEPIEVRVQVDGETFRDRTTLCAATVGPSIGGGFLVSPTATPHDGRLDLCFVEALNHLQVALYLPRVIRGKHEQLDVVRLRRFQKARFEAPDGRPFHFQLDGEVMSASTPWLEVQVLKDRLTVLIPGESS